MSNNNWSTISRDYALKFIFHLQSPKYKNLIQGLKKEKSTNNYDLEKELNSFHESYLRQDDEHPNNTIEHKGLCFAKTLIEKVFNNYDELLTIIEKHLTGWKINNLDSINLSILLLGTCELQYISNTPTNVVINEAVNLAHTYGAKDSYTFVNGVLDKIAKNIRG